jgi:type I restriction enzyme, S subunit
VSPTLPQTLPGSLKTIRLKWLLSALESGRREISDTEEYTSGALSIGGEHIGWQGQWKLNNPRFVPLDFYEKMTTGKIHQNDVLLVKDGATIGKVAIAEQLPAPQSAVNEHVFLLRFSDANCPKFYFYFIQSSIAQDQIQLEVRGSAQPGLNSEFRNSVIAPNSPYEQQHAIADYLDKATAKIDSMIAAKERLLELLAEKRRALITQAVTRGLNPEAPMRDPGISWLGKIPAHWEMWKINHFAKVGNGSTPNRDNMKYWNEGSIPWLNSSVVNSYEVKDADQFVTDLAAIECHLPIVPRNSVLVGITGQGKTRGQAVVLSFPSTINQHLAFITPVEDSVESWYLRWLLFVSYDYLRSISDDMGGTKGALTCEVLSELRLPLPPLHEQRPIIAYINQETTKLDSLKQATERAIGLLKERRSALIAYAVTGSLHIEERTFSA